MRRPCRYVLITGCQQEFAGSKTFLQHNPPILNWGYQLDMYNGYKTNVTVLSAKSREYVFTGVGWCYCLSVTTITKKIVNGFVPNFMGRVLEGREDQVCVSLQSVEGCGSSGQKTP